jgi:Peptidase M15
MRQFIHAAALAATLFLAPATVPAAPSPVAVSAPVRVAAQASAPAPAAPDFGLADHEHVHGSGLAPGQTPADFSAWLSRSPAHRAELAAFEARLASQGVEHVVPLWQLVRTSSSWRQCAAQPFEVAPRDKWDNIVATLKFVRDEVVPALGPVEALSAYRNESLNACSDGAPRSAHRLFFALDLTPVRAEVSRAGMIRDICRAHARDGRAYNAGLGFYSGRRFHVDSNGFRKWGPDGSGATSPCVTGIA